MTVHWRGWHVCTAHSVYRHVSWYEGRDPPSSRRLWCNGRQTSQYRLSGNVEVGRGEEGRQTPMARPSHPDYLVPPPVRAPQRLQWPRQTWFIEVDAIKSGGLLHIFTHKCSFVHSPNLRKSTYFQLLWLYLDKGCTSLLILQFFLT